jgi:hypothetical protein
MFCGKYLPNALPPPSEIPREFAKFCMKLTASACERCMWDRQRQKNSCTQ